MLTRALPALPRLTLPLTLSFVVVCGMTIYAALFGDPHVVLFMTPFFLLGCARGRHPLTLLALSTIPAFALLSVSLVKTMLTGFSLVTYDGYFIRENLLMLAYNDWRVSTGLIVLIGGIVFYLRSLFSGRGAFTRFERRSAVALGVASVGCMIGVQQWDQDIFDWEYELSRPSVRGFVKSVRIPESQLALPATAAELPPLKNLSLGAPPGALPDLFFILQESTFHPRLVRPGYEPTTLFSSQASHTGDLHVHTYGGGTWMTEFSLVSQMRPQEFGNGGLYVFHQLEGRIKRSVFTLLKELGYRTIVVYPVPGEFINARNFYKSIGVDEFYDPESLGISKGWDWEIPDKKFYEAIQRKIEGTKQPIALLMLTIIQHGPHDAIDPVTDYLTRFEQSDEAYGSFLDFLLLRGRKAGVVAFGDHHPDFTNSRMPDEHTKELTAYEIRCLHFNCTNKALARNKSRTLDIGVLTPIALEEFGFSLDDLSLLQKTLLGTCDADLSRCDETARLQFNSAFSQFVK